MFNILNFFTRTIDKWNESLNNFTGKYMDNAAFAGIAVLLLFAIGCWAISYLTKK